MKIFMYNNFSKIFTAFFILFIVQSSIFNSFAQSPNTWTQKASFPGVPRIGTVGFNIGTKAYVGTGQDSSLNLLTDFWEYDPSANTWTRLADFPGSARRDAVGFFIGSKGYVGTGFDGANNLKDFWEYDPSLNSWTQKKNLGGNVNTNSRREAIAFTLNNNGYVATGYDGNNVYNRECWKFDGDTTWIRKADINSNFSTGKRWAVSFTIDSSAYIGCGFNYSQDFKKDVWRYNLAANTWTQRADFGGDGRSRAVAFSSRGRGFIGTGNNTHYESDFWQYNPQSNVWIQVTDYPGAIIGGIGLTLNDTGYVGLGRDSIAFRTDFWQYTPDSTIGILENPDQRLEATVFPNPFSTSATLKIGDDKQLHSGIYNFTLYDANGNKVREESLTKNFLLIERKKLLSGIYFYSIWKGGSYNISSSGKIVID